MGAVQKTGLFISIKGEYKMAQAEKFKQGQEVVHSNLGLGVFSRYELHEGECVVIFTDKFNYQDELRVSVGLLTAKEKGVENMKVVIGRPINGIPLNGLEYLTDEDGSRKEFETKEEAVVFLRANGCHDFTEDEIEDSFMFELTGYNK